MRCLNCHTVLAPNDLRCISCGAATQVKRAVDAGTPVTPVQDRKNNRMSAAIAFTMFGLALLGAGAAAVYLNQNKEAAPAGPQKVTADDLMKVAASGKIDNPWVVYTPERVYPTGLELVWSTRLGRKQVQTRYYLAPVGDRYLIAEVKPNFTGVRLEGQLQVRNSPMHTNLLAKLRREVPDKASRLLPFMVDCEDTYEGQTWTNKWVGICLAGFGALCLFLGVAGFFVRPKQG
jgi:hypothetical protein